MSLPSYTYIEKDVEEYPSSSSPLETKIVVGGCAFNSLVEHPYKDAFSSFSIPAGLVVAKGGTHELNMTSLTREMVQKGGSVEAGIVNEDVFDELFKKVSAEKRVRRLTRKKRD